MLGNGMRNVLDSVAYLGRLPAASLVCKAESIADKREPAGIFPLVFPTPLPMMREAASRVIGFGFDFGLDIMTKLLSWPSEMRDRVKCFAERHAESAVS